MAKETIIISGGGTGGHIFPAIAIAHALQAADSTIDILFVGARGKMEMQRVPAAGYPIIGLWISGLQRKLTVSNLLFPVKVISSVSKALGIVRKYRPVAVVGVGGYASGPLVYAATMKGIPAVLQEQNSYAGITNKILAKRVQQVCVAYDKMERFFPAENIRFTGNPVRSDIVKAAAEGLDSRKEEALGYYQLKPGVPTLLVVGGSLGARTLNRSLAASLAQLKENNIQVIWQCGKFYYEEMKATLEAAGNPGNIHLHQFLDRMDLAYAAADVVISRAGALSISELCLVQLPVIFVPSPNVAEDHQRKNASALVEKNAALMVLDRDAEQQMIPQALALLENKGKQQELKKNIGQLARPEAAAAIAEIILKLKKAS